MNTDKIKTLTREIKIIEKALDILRVDNLEIEENIIGLLVSEIIEREQSIDTLILNRK